MSKFAEFIIKQCDNERCHRKEMHSVKEMSETAKDLVVLQLKCFRCGEIKYAQVHKFVKRTYK